jgi:hypothetical protein
VAACEGRELANIVTYPVNLSLPPTNVSSYPSLNSLFLVQDPHTILRQPVALSTSVQKRWAWKNRTLTILPHSSKFKKIVKFKKIRLKHIGRGWLLGPFEHIS